MTMTIADQIFEKRARGVEPKWFAEFFQKLIWMMNDDGIEICQAMRQWVVSGDVERAKVALEFTDAFYFRNRAEMLQVLTDLVKRFPELSQQCNEYISLWDHK
jgi:hypothetical protein